MHIAPFDNHNRPIVDVDDERVPLNYFNIVKLDRDETFEYRVPGYETCIVPATGTVDVAVGNEYFSAIGQRVDVQWWGRDPAGPFGTYLSDALTYWVGL